MTVAAQRQAWMVPFEERRATTSFFSRMFDTGPQNRFDTDTVEIDIERNDADVAIVVEPGDATSIAGPRLAKADDFTNKEWRPAAYNPGAAFTMKDVAKRGPGESPFDDPAYQSRLLKKVIKTSVLNANKLIRAQERQAAQVLQTGVVSLINAAGVVLYTLNFGPKATHFPTVGTAWSNAAADIRGDLTSLAKVIRNDSGMDSTDLFLGETAIENLFDNSTLQNQADVRRFNGLVDIAPRFADSGASFMGEIRLANYKFRLWTYNGYFKHEQTGVATDYLAADKVIMVSDKTRFDRLSGTVNDVIVPDARMAPFLPGRLTGELDATPHGWVAPNGKSITVELPSRFLMVPTQIDGYGCIDTDP